jgi:hypothetical protein
MKYIFRDDYIDKDTPLEVVKHVHNQFINSHKTHTVTVICEGMEKNTPVIQYINKTHNWDIAIHGWEMVNYCLAPKQKISDDLDKCILKIESLFGVVPEKWYLPWNGWTKENNFDLVPLVADIALYHGVDIDIDCDHISHALNVIESGKNPVTNTIYFNNKDVNDLRLLPNLLYLTNKRGGV